MIRLGRRWKDKSNPPFTLGFFFLVHSRSSPEKSPPPRWTSFWLSFRNSFHLCSDRTGPTSQNPASKLFFKAEFECTLKLGSRCTEKAPPLDFLSFEDPFLRYVLRKFRGGLLIRTIRWRLRGHSGFPFLSPGAFFEHFPIPVPSTRFLIFSGESGYICFLTPIVRHPLFLPFSFNPPFIPQVVPRPKRNVWTLPYFLRFLCR